MIKRLPLFIFILCASSYAHAQISKGSLFLGGRVQYSTLKHETTSSPDQSNTSYLTISPAIGTAIKENLILGVELDYRRTKEAANNVDTRNEKNYGGALFLRQYLLLGKNFYFFGQGNTGVSVFKNEYPTNPLVDNKGYRISLGVYPGISYAVNNKIHIESGLNNIVFIDYTSSKSVPVAGQESKSTSFNVGTSLSSPISFNIGIRFILPG
jgi:hypothetical protein